MQGKQHEFTSWLEQPLSFLASRITIEKIIIIIIILLAVVSRFYNVGERVMSHDEVNHVVPSFDLFQGRGYRHDPVTHGPLQFHLIALSYFLLGDNDFSSRVPSVLFSIATVAFVLIAFRKYLGRTGTLVAGLLFTISPYMLFYGRYARNESFVALFGVVLLYATMRYLEKGDDTSLFLVTLATCLHFTSKETAYIYTAQFLVLCAFLFLEEIVHAPWAEEKFRQLFIIFMSLALFLVFVTLGLSIWNTTLIKAAELSTPVAEGVPPAESGFVSPIQPFLYISLLGTLLAGGAAIFIAVSKLGWQELRSKRSFDLLMLVGSLILPLLAAFPVLLVGWNPLDYSSIGIVRTGVFVVILFALSVVVGLWWKPKAWLYHAAVFWGIFIVFYTTFFTNGQGFFTGLIGSLGYWLSQQGETRGNQPLYYYLLVQLPIYEYLAVLGTLLAGYIGIRYQRFSFFTGRSPVEESSEESGITEVPSLVTVNRRVPVLFILLFWSITSLLAFSFAGEKMPWLTVHIALPLLLAAGWGIGFIIDHIEWRKIANLRGFIIILLMLVLLTSLFGAVRVLGSAQPPFQGKTLEQLEATSTFLLSVVTGAASIIALAYLMKDWSRQQAFNLIGVVFLSITALLTARTAYTANYINYDNAKEFLVYAHAARGPKDILKQVEEISMRLTGGLDVVVAYDNDSLYPYWWYFRNYPNHRWFSEPTRDLSDAPLIIASDENYGKLESILRDNYVYFDYIRLWWPMMDYFNLTWDRVWSALKDPAMREALFEIWLNRDYTRYAQLTNNTNLTLENWYPSERFRFYIRKDVVSQIWEYGSAPVAMQEVQPDPYLNNMLQLMPDRVIGETGAAPGQLQSPRGLDIAPDGSLYVADSRNHRIQHFSENGDLLQTWGVFADAASGNAPGGTFNEPWDVAVAPDGSVFVADTWNHRIQKFTADGTFLMMWGHFVDAGQGPEGLWGPRSLAFDSKGYLYITDTGNKRVLIYDQNGQFINEFGSAGFGAGQLDEPVGIDINAQDWVYIADTWNQRIQVFQPFEGTLAYQSMLTWDIDGWFGQSLENKPYLATDSAGNVFVTDPEGYRVLEFSSMGDFIRGWGDYSPSIDGFGLPSGIAVDAEGRVWVSDAGNNRLLRFTLP